jgi:hypothetical protein
MSEVQRTNGPRRADHRLAIQPVDDHRLRPVPSSPGPCGRASPQSTGRSSHLTPMPYVALQTMLDEAAAWGSYPYKKTVYVADLSDPVIEVVTENMPRKNAPLSGMLCYPLDGAYSKVGEQDTAFAADDHRGSTRSSRDGARPRSAGRRAHPGSERLGGVAPARHRSRGKPTATTGPGPPSSRRPLSVDAEATKRHNVPQALPSGTSLKRAAVVHERLPRGMGPTR